VKLWCEYAWLDGDRAEPGVVLDVENDRIVAVETGVGVAPTDADRLAGLVLPGLVNAHSHAFHRALRGRTHGEQGSFWSWRDQMYRLAGTLTPDSYRALATATYAEMALAGITTVGEFHYLHHGAGGMPYDEPNAVSDALVEAAETAGIRLTLLDTCYLHGGVGKELDEVQQRFADRSVDRWIERVEAFDGRVSATVRSGVAIHSVRAVEPDEMAAIARWAAGREVCVHAHVSEQPAENEASLAAYGATPVGVLSRAGALGSRFTAVHATHVTDDDISRLGTSGSSVCLCPTTERDLADGIGPGAALAAAGADLCVGSDSHAVIDLFEEARAIELDERLATGQRGHHLAGELLAAATCGGAGALGWSEAGSLAPGRLADLVALRLDSVRLAGTGPDHLVAAAAFAATASDVGDVMVGGRWVVRDGQHVTLDVPALLTSSIAEVWGE
jgi:formiminoglutamate deiminase